jgi:DNA-binding response OmpR family regulator
LAAPKEVAAATRAVDTLTFEPGAFIYRTHRESLSGLPLQVLQALHQALGSAQTLQQLYDAIWKDRPSGEEAVRSAVKTARKALRRAMRAVAIEVPADPIPNVDRGTGRTAWRLDLP